MSRRIGLYGGSFNPVHLGHLRTAEEVYRGLHLREVWMVPARLPPHKDWATVLQAPARLRMLELALRGADGLRAEPVELEREGPSYTIDTVRILKQRHPGVRFALILGLDAFREFDTWHDFEALFRECDLIVTSRPPDCVTRGENAAVLRQLPIAVQQAFWYEPSVECYANEGGHRLEFFPVTQLDISSSALRGDVLAGRSIRFLVPEAVSDFIAEHGLYRNPPRG